MEQQPYHADRNRSLVKREALRFPGSLECRQRFDGNCRNPQAVTVTHVTVEKKHHFHSLTFFPRQQLRFRQHLHSPGRRGYSLANAILVTESMQQIFLLATTSPATFLGPTPTNLESYLIRWYKTPPRCYSTWCEKGGTKRIQNGCIRGRFTNVQSCPVPLAPRGP